MIENIKEILNIAIWAPSGDNSQPWKFEIKDNNLYIFNIPDRDNPILNFKQSGSYIAHGALIENISIIAPNFGLKANIDLFPDSSNINLVSIISFQKMEIKKNHLFDYIKQRVTNRKPYKKDKLLTQEQKQELLNETDNIVGGKVIFVEDVKRKKIVANVLSTMEKVALETKALHRLFFGGILWKNKDNEDGKYGLYIKTLELPPPIRLIFKLLKYWFFTNLFNKIGFSNLASKGNAQTYAKSSALYVVAIDQDISQYFVNAGRISQRIWLNATRLGLSVQPVTGLLFLARKVNDGDTEVFSEKHIFLIKEANEKIKSIFGLQNETMAMTFRIGYADQPTARSSRQNPDITIRA